MTTTMHDDDDDDDDDADADDDDDDDEDDNDKERHDYDVYAYEDYKDDGSEYNNIDTRKNVMMMMMKLIMMMMMKLIMMMMMMMMMMKRRMRRRMLLMLFLAITCVLVLWMKIASVLEGLIYANTIKESSLYLTYFGSLLHLGKGHVWGKLRKMG